MRPRVGRPLAALLLVGWSVTLWWLLTADVSGGPRFPGSAFLVNLSHAGLFGVEALLLGMALRPGRIGAARWPWLAASGIALAYSGWLEWQQGTIDGRDASWCDLATNAVGAFGAPWVLTLERIVSRRLLVVVLAACAAALAATWARP